MGPVETGWVENSASGPGMDQAPWHSGLGKLEVLSSVSGPKKEDTPHPHTEFCLKLGVGTGLIRLTTMFVLFRQKEVWVESGGLTLCVWFSGKSDLTVDAVRLHNELQSGSLHLGKSEGPETAMEDGEELAFTEKSSGTFLSGLSDCTNVTFSKVQRFWESNSAAHKEVPGGLGGGG